ncbi:MAG: PH domain-containing protein [Planctomycetota bacterium]
MDDDQPIVTDNTPEQEVWAGGPSQYINLGLYIACILIIPIPYAIYRWLRVRCTQYAVTTERLHLTEGILARTTEELELYRVKDTAFSQSVFERIFSLGTIKLTTSDASHPEVTLQSIPLDEAQNVREQIRHITEELRQKKRVREVDYT